MLANLFESTTIPALEQVVNFAQARHTVLVGNIANADTPGYQARDLSVEEFQKELKAALSDRDAASKAISPGEMTHPHRRLAEVAKNTPSILRHDLGNVGMEHQVSEMVKNQLQHNLALSIMTSQFRLLQTAVSGKV